METFIYILAPHTISNYAIFKSATITYPDLIENRQIGKAYEKNMLLDTIDSEGALMMPDNEKLYIFVKARVSEFDPAIIADVTDVTTYTVDNLPTNEYWLNVNL